MYSRTVSGIAQAENPDFWLKEGILKFRHSQLRGHMGTCGFFMDDAVGVFLGFLGNLP